jgi:hypothetical protein
MRLSHRYLGIFTAPALLFFALTGAMQTFSLHESKGGSSYHPPAWIAILAQIHKKQTPIVPVKKTAAAQPKARTIAGPGDRAAAAAAGATQTHNPLPLKIYFLLVAVALFSSTVTGVYMAYKYMRRRLAVTALLVAGLLIPVVLVLI